MKHIQDLNKSCLTSVRAIVKRNGKLLLAQRSHEVKRKKGYWEFPGGKTDCKEPKGAVKRELKEELNLNMKNPKFIKEKKVGKYFVRYYSGNASGKIKLQHSEVEGAGWFTPNQAKKLNLVNHTRMLI